MSDRPALDPGLTEEEFRRWYWTMAELQPFARSLGVRAAGPKRELSDRIAAALGQRPDPTPRPASRSTKRRPRPAAPLALPLTVDTVIPPGQRSTQQLRAFFEETIGPEFSFNGHLRAFLAEGGGTLGDAITHWHSTRGLPLPEQSESLELNRFTSAWHAAHPDGSAADCRAAWRRYRSLPVDQRPEIADA